jgi:hypothetical protein
MMPRRTDISRLRICAAMLLLGSAAPAFAESRFEREVFGPFTVETEIYENSGYSIMHVPDRWTKVKLIWRSSDGQAELSLVDEGWQVTIHAELPTANGPCLSTVAPIGGISQPPSSDAFWRWTTGKVEELMATCNPRDPGRKAAYRPEMAASGGDYPRAADAWKAASVKAFGTLEGRCVQTQPSAGVFPGMECVKWSGEQLDRAKLADLRRRCGIKSGVLVYKSNLELQWRIAKGEALDDGLLACAYQQLRPYKGVNIQLEFLKGNKG